jgi:hypothetical protein
LTPLGGLSGYVPGWTAKGHPGYWGYAWYRINVHLQERSGEKLALAGPSIVPFTLVVGLWWCIYLNLPHVRAYLRRSPSLP